ncbi:MAG: HD domain-containing protein [Aquabacterium sp.]
MALVLAAAAFAAHKHRDQRRKDAQASPYINHPLALARILAVEGGVSDPVTLAAALLHDTVEDTDTTPQDLRQRFGDAVASVVGEVTDDKAVPKPQRKQAQVDHAPHLSPRAKLVKIADKIANLRDVDSQPPPDWDLARRQGYFDWAARVVAGLRGHHVGLDAVFDAAYARRPS